MVLCFFWDVYSAGFQFVSAFLSTDSPNLSCFFGFLVSFAKSVMVAVLTDPLMFMLVGGILLYVYMDEFLSEFQ